MTHPDAYPIPTQKTPTPRHITSTATTNYNDQPPRHTMAIFTELPDDLVDRILACLPDFNTLAAVLRTSKAYTYAVFQARPKYIIQSIALNVVGPALPQAMKLVHVVSDDTDDLQSVIPDDDIVALTRKQTQTLERNASTVAAIEDLFSIRHKDRSSVESKLSYSESLRFRRALYRFWEVCCVVSEEENQDSEDDSDEDEDDAYDDNRSKAILLKVVNVLSALETSELYEMGCVASFLREIVTWSQRARDQLDSTVQAVDYILMEGPEVMLSNFTTGGTSWAYHSSAGINFQIAFVQVCNARKINVETREAQTVKAIIQEVRGEHDACYRCYGIQGVNLWGRSNWHLLRGFVTPRTICSMLDGNLPRNQVETNDLTQYLMASGIRPGDSHERPTFDWSLFLEELCDVETDAEGAWDKNQWYCTDCILGLIKLRLRIWWIARKIRDNRPAMDDCWYGYNCRTQVHKYAHAGKLNHLCEPTRG